MTLNPSSQATGMSESEEPGREETEAQGEEGPCPRSPLCQLPRIGLELPLTEAPQDQANPRQGPSGPPWGESPHLSPARQGLLVCGGPIPHKLRHQRQQWPEWSCPKSGPVHKPL